LSDYYYQPQEPMQNRPGLSIASMILGIVGVLAWCIPCFGFPVCIVGLILGILGMKKGGKGMAIAGIILSAIFLFFTLINSILGALGAVGQLY